MINRLFGGGKAKSPQATNLQTQKNKQIESLRNAYLSVVETIRDVEYRVSTVSGATNITLIISLPTQFPQEKPIVSVQPPITHPWVDIHMKVVACPNINNFSMHSDLGIAVQAIIDEFRRTPPRLLPHLGSQFGAVPPAVQPGPSPGYPMFGINPNQPLYSPLPPPPKPPRLPDTNPPQATTTNSVFPVPDIMAAFPDLQNKGLFELQELVDNEDKIVELMQCLPELSNFSCERENLSAQCVRLATENLSRRPVVEELKSSVLEKMAELDRLKGEFENNCEQHLVLSDQFSLTCIQTNLKVAVMEAEEESDKIADDFLDKKMELDEFVHTYISKRTLCHLRRAKEEKLNQIIMASGSNY